MSLMQFNNLSLLTYGALGLTGVALAIASVYETSETAGSDEVADAAALSSVPTPAEEPASSGLFGSEEKPEESEGTGLFGSEEKPEESEGTGLFGSEEKPTEESEGNGLFGQSREGERIGGKKKKRGTKKNKKGGSKKSRKTKHRKQKKSKQSKK
jgi:hypothetical protein